MTIEKLKSDIEFKKMCIFYTKRVIKNPPIDEISLTMLSQKLRLESELSQLEKQLNSLYSVQETQKPKKKQKVTKRRKK